jgi:hypothetical protein
MVSVLLLAACSLPSRPVPVVRDPGAGVRVYLQPLPQETHRLKFVISSITARRADGGEVALLSEPKEIRPDDLIGHQSRLVSANLPPGDYVGLNLQIEGATLMTDEGENDLLVPEKPIAIDEAFRVRADQTTALFLSISSDRLVTAGYRFTPHFSLWGSRPALPGLKGVVTNNAAGTLTLFEKKTPTVTNVVALGRAPGEVVFDAARSPTSPCPERMPSPYSTWSTSPCGPRSPCVPVTGPLKWLSPRMATSWSVPTPDRAASA